MSKVKKPDAAKLKKKGTHEFFTKNASSGLMFNKAPLNKNVALAETREKIMSDRNTNDRVSNTKKSKSFLTKLY